MAVAVPMPRQGQSVESCILTTWFAGEGDRVNQGELLFAYETDKAAFEEEAPRDGILLARFFEEGDEVPVLHNVAVIGEEGEAVEEFRPGEDSGAAKRPGQDTAKKGPSQEVPEPSERTAISPRARRLAKEKRVVTGSIRGSGPGGRIIERDVAEAYRQGNRLTPLANRMVMEEGLTVSQVEGPLHGRISKGNLAGTDRPEFRDVPLGNVRKIIAGSMFYSLQNSAQLTHHLGANAHGMLLLRNEVKDRISEGYAYNITLNDMVCFAVIRALENHPEANAHFLGDAVRVFNRVNLGLAVDTERGLTVPALPDAGRFTLPDLSESLKVLADQAKKGSISPDLLQPEAATFTVSNLGNYGVEMFTPIINLPQVAILGVNAIVQRPATLSDGSFGFQPFIGLSLTYDHRAIDGGPATRFLAEIKQQIESINPGLLAES